MSAVDFGSVRWRKSSRSGGEQGDECVEVAHVDVVTGVRDSKNPTGPVLTFSRAGWSLFLSNRGAGD